MIRYDSKGHLSCEDIRLVDLCDHYPTPFYLYSRSEIESKISHLKRSLKKTFLKIDFCYAVKALSNISVLKLFAQNDLGADVVSEGELTRALLAGVSPSKIVFSGVGKSKEAIELGIRYEIGAFHVESLEEIEVLGELSLSLSTEKKIKIALRLNPDIETKTHKKIATGSKDSKFGIDHRLLNEALDLVRKYPSLELKGISCHIGSQIHQLSSYERAAKKMLNLFLEIKKKSFPLDYIDLGGGFGVNYFNFKNTPDFSVENYVLVLNKVFKQYADIKLILEPGRWLVSSSGILVSKVLHNKRHYGKNFLILDASMTELIRPSLYQAHHDILPVHVFKNSKKQVKQKQNSKQNNFVVVGPVCESGDIFTEKTDFNKMVMNFENPYVAILNCGAYASSMASQYNSRTLKAEYLVSGRTVECIREEQNLEDLWKLEKL